MKFAAWMFAALAALTPLLGAAQAADYDRSEHEGKFEMRLRVPEAAMAIAPLQKAIMERYRHDIADFRKDALTPLTYDVHWRTTYRSARLISLSAEIFWDGGGAHPNTAFETLIWDKTANRALGFADLFAPEDRKAAQAAIANAGMAAWMRLYAARSGEHASPDLKEMATEGIAADDEHLKNVALMYEAGDAKASGLLLLYGAGEIWPHVVGDFRIPVPAGVFKAYLRPEWRSEFR